MSVRSSDTSGHRHLFNTCCAVLHMSAGNAAQQGLGVDPSAKRSSRPLWLDFLRMQWPSASLSGWPSWQNLPPWLRKRGQSGKALVPVPSSWVDGVYGRESHLRPDCLFYYRCLPEWLIRKGLHPGEGWYLPRPWQRAWTASPTPGFPLNTGEACATASLKWLRLNSGR